MGQGIGEIAQWLEALAVLVEDHSQLSEALVPKDQMPSSGIHGHFVDVLTYMQAKSSKILQKSF